MNDDTEENNECSGQPTQLLEPHKSRTVPKEMLHSTYLVTFFGAVDKVHVQRLVRVRLGVPEEVV